MPDDHKRPVTVNLYESQVDWLDDEEENPRGRSYAVREAIRQYRESITAEA